MALSYAYSFSLFPLRITQGKREQCEWINQTALTLHLNLRGSLLVAHHLKRRHLVVVFLSSGDGLLDVSGGTATRVDGRSASKRNFLPRCCIVNQMREDRRAILVWPTLFVSLYRTCIFAHSGDEVVRWYVGAGTYGALRGSVDIMRL